MDELWQEQTGSFSSRYQVLESIGEGGMGSVFRAFDRVLKRTVAIKTISALASKESSVIRFQKEARLAATVTGRHVVSIYDFGVAENGDPYLVMEYVKGRALRDVLAERGALALAEGLEVLDQIAAGLSSVHQAGIVHRDLKTGNIVLDMTDGDGPLIKLLDFGIAKRSQNDEVDALTRTGDIIGSPYYMSPEQARGEAVDARSDIYSLGCIAYEIFSGKVPFAGDTALDTINMHLRRDPEPLSSVATVPAELDGCLARMLAKRREDRFETMTEVRRALQAVPLVAAPALPAADTRRRGAPLLAAGVIACLSLAVVALMSIAPEPSLLPSSKEEAGDGACQKETSICALKDIFSPDSEPGHVESFVYYGEDASALLAESTEKGTRVRVLLVGQEIEEPDFKKALALAPRVVILSQCSLDDERMRALAGLASMEDLRLNQIRELSDRGLLLLAGNKNIKALALRDCGLTDESIAILSRFPSLRKLDLSNNRGITASGLQLLKGKGLNELEIGDCPNCYAKVGDALELSRSLGIPAVLTVARTDTKRVVPGLKAIGGLTDLFAGEQGMDVSDLVITRPSN
ncbi:MAG: protein kinase [Candidatus Melainabacteria bacterium]|nr:protein kinase [Candidatus Melainabacteria bacterium]